MTRRFIIQINNSESLIFRSTARDAIKDDFRCLQMAILRGDMTSIIIMGRPE